MNTASAVSDTTKGKSRMKKIMICIAALIIVGGAGVGVYAAASSSASGEEISRYREYTVSSGSITMGTSESGTISVEREYVTFPGSAEVEELYVNTGSKVSEGDKLMKLSADDIASAKASYENRIAQAKLDLEKAELDRQTNTLKAQQTMDAAIEKGSSAQSEYELFIAKNENSKSESQSNLENLKKQLDEYKEMSLTVDADYAVLSEYEEKLEELEDKYSEMESEYKALQKIDNTNQKAVNALKTEYDNYTDSISEQYENITKLKENREKAQEAADDAYEAYISAQEEYDEAVKQSNSGSSDTSDSSQSANTVTTAQKKLTAAKEAYDEALSALRSAKAAYSSYYISLGEKIEDTIEDYENRIKELQKVYDAHFEITEDCKEQLDDYSDTVSAYRTEYESFKSDYTDIYGSNDPDSIADKISELTSSVSSAELNIQSSAASESSELLSAEQDMQSAVSNAENAQTVYDQTVASLDSEVASAQEEYDDLLDEYSDFLEYCDDEGYIYAPCGGTVASVGVSEGDTTNSMSTLVNIMDSRYIYLSASVSEEDITSLTVGQECSIELTAYENKTFSGKIYTIAAEPARSSGSVSYTVTVKLDDESGLNVYEGMTGEVTFLQKQVANTLYVNVNAVEFRDGASYVKVYDENGNVVEKEVLTGFTDGSTVEIISGVSAGEKVLAEVKLS
ncbi:MAG: efflux RND transporter periplasmic adaptor subunit [Huintestinicola sp.]